MTEVIPLKEQKWPRDHRNIHDDLDAQLDDIYAVASLLAAMDSDSIFIGQVNATGYLLTRMITEARKIEREHYELWLEEIAESQKE